MTTVKIPFIFFDDVSKRQTINNPSTFFIKINRSIRIGFNNLFFHHKCIYLFHFLYTFI